MPDNRFDRGTIIKCRVEGCLRPTMIRKHNLCRAHYMRWWEGKPVEGPIAPRRKLAIFEKGKKPKKDKP